MCGIAGFLSLQQSAGPEFLLQASDLLRHRGPDDEGYLFIGQDNQTLQAVGRDTDAALKGNAWTQAENLQGQFFKAGLLHRRLSIIAPDAGGHQPMHDAEEDVWISFNGEIYNYKALRSELEGLGHRFRTQTDTEVLLNAWKHWGQDCLHRLDGMWAFALLDLRQKVFFAATDPAGIKPFYYRYDTSGFQFASEIKALYPGNLSPDQHEIARFLIRGQSDESHRTHFSGIHRLQGGCFLRMSLTDSASPQQKQWHQTAVKTGAEDYSLIEFERISLEIQEILQKVVSLRLQADVPLGICLSGGLDSSAIAGMVAHLSRNQALQFPAKAFMAVLPPGQQPDESPFAREMAASAGLNLHTTCPDASDFVHSLADMIHHLDAPAPGMNAFSQYAVFRLVSQEGVKVTLDGQGADELFGGYPAHRLAWLREEFQLGNFRKFSASTYLAVLQQELRNQLLPELEWQLLRKSKPEFSIFHKSVFEEAGPKNPRTESGLNNLLYRDFTSGTLPFLLKAADRNSMRWSVESRMPFADSAQLTARLFSLSGNMKMHEGRSKALLREAVKNQLPQTISQRKDKVGFASPQTVWLNALLKSELIRDLPECSEWIDSTAFRRYAEAFMKNPASVDPLILWRALAFRIWYAIFYSGLPVKS